LITSPRRYVIIIIKKKIHLKTPSLFVMFKTNLYMHLNLAFSISINILLKLINISKGSVILFDELALCPTW
jgi:hypothetical protein